MERHGIDEQQAFQLLREHARRTNKKMVDVAGSIVESHRLLSRGNEPVDPGGELLAPTDQPS